MASFGVSLVDAGSVAAAAAAAGLMNAMTAAPPPPPGAFQLVAHVSAKVVNYVQVAGNIASLVALLMPMYTYVVPVWHANGVGDRTIFGFIFVFFNVMIWLLFAIPSKPRSVFTLIVNSVGIATETFYIILYLKNTVGHNLRCSRHVVICAAAIALTILTLMVSLVLLTDVWSVKVLRFTAATVATLTSIGGLIDVVIFVRNGRSAFNIYHLAANFMSASIWAGYGFLFKPSNKYIVVPNLTNMGVIIVQGISHAVQWFKDQKNAARGHQPAGNQVAMETASPNHQQPAGNNESVDTAAPKPQQPAGSHESVDTAARIHELP